MALTSLLAIVPRATARAQEIERLKAGIVKIVTHVEDKRRVGTGFIVRLEPNAAYILTASHVIEGDPEPSQVTFQTAPTQSFSAKVIGMEGGDPAGLAALVVQGDLPHGLLALGIDETEAKSGDPIVIIGFPLLLGTPWTVVEGQVSGFKGRVLTFQAPIEEGNSGGPLLKNGRVIGVITEKHQAFGSAVNALIAQVTLKGWGVEARAESETPVSISGMLSNSGWIINFSFTDRPREISYKLGSGSSYKSTGMSDNRDQQTGLRVPQYFMMLPAEHIAGKTTIHVKYKDQRGRERGPFELTFDPAGERLKEAKNLLGELLTNDWASFRYYVGNLTVYFSTLLSYRDVLKSIRYSIDNETLSESFPFTPWTAFGEIPDLSGDDPVWVDVPLATRYVAVKLEYIDGTESELKTFRKPEGMANKEGVEELKRQLAKDPAAAKSKDSDGRTLLHTAAQEGQVGVVKLLLASGAQVDARDDDRRTALHYAADAGHEGQGAVAAILLSHGADINARDESGDDPLHLVVARGTKAFVELLIAHKGDVTAVNNRKETPLHLAGSTAVAEALLANHANLEARDDHDETPLHHAADDGRKDLAEVLIARGATVNARTSWQWTPLHAAAQRGNHDMVRFLLAKGADPNAASDRAETPLHAAARQGHAEIVPALLAKKASIDARDADQQTPLHAAVDGGYLDVVQALLAGKADLNAKDSDGRTPLDLAVEKQAAEIVRALKGHKVSSSR